MHTARAAATGRSGSLRNSFVGGVPTDRGTRSATRIGNDSAGGARRDFGARDNRRTGTDHCGERHPRPGLNHPRRDVRRRLGTGG
jgi:hypothetical protein